MDITHSSTSSDSLDEAGRLVGALYGAPMTLTAEPPVDFRFEASAVHDGRFSLARLKFGGEVTCVTDSLGEYVVAHSISGGHAWRVGAESGVGAVPFLVSPERRMEIDMRRVDLLSLGFERDFLERVVGRKAGQLTHVNDIARNPSAFAPVMRYLDSAMRAHPGVFGEPVFRASALQLAIDTLLEVFPIEAPTRERRAGARAVRRAVAHIDDHLADGLTVTDVAEAIGVTRPELEVAFAQVLGTSPAEHLRRARLAAARADLLAAAPEETDVPTVARRWGFGMLGRFARRYRRAYGERPGDTLVS